MDIYAAEPYPEDEEIVFAWGFNRGYSSGRKWSTGMSDANFAITANFMYGEPTIKMFYLRGITEGINTNS